MDMKVSDKNSFAYSLNFLKKLNAVSFNGKPVSCLKIFDKYNVWIFFQTRIFFGDLKFLSDKLDKFSVPRPSARIIIQDFLLSCLGLTLSSAALAVAILSKKKVLVYSIDRANSTILSNDARLDPIYKYLKEHGIPYLEYFHTIFDRQFVMNLMTRRRVAVYLRSIDSLYRVGRTLGFIRPTYSRIGKVDLSNFEPEERHYAKYLLSKYISTIDLVKFRVKVLQKILSWMDLKVLLTIDNTRDYFELILACQLNSIPVMAFQHGHFTKYHVGWLDDGSFEGEIVRPDKLYVWSEYWKRELLRLGTYFPKNAIEVGGLKVKTDSRPIKPLANVGVLIPYEVDSVKVEVKKYIDKLLSCKGIKVFFKLRTDLNKDKQLAEYGLESGNHPNLELISDLNVYLSEINVVAGTYSTFLYDMIAYLKPVVILKTSSDFGEGLLKNHLATEVTINNLCRKVIEISKTPEDMLLNKKKILFGESEKLMYDTVSRIGEELRLNSDDTKDQT